ncbi:MAG: spore coat protein U domain-containing protein [Candidatus Eremiobacteraeota bacterium]|nr:spore coat protein U domain-containing protein [Candidatus Eremiobacteraeota bacterium]
MNTKSLIGKALAYATATLVFCAAPLTAPASTTTGALNVSATISNNCVFGTSTMAFGAYDPVSANASTALAVTGTVNLTCTKSDAITLTADAGANGSSASGSCATATCTRAMKSGSNYLSYDLYTTSGHSTVWNTSNNIPATATGVSQAVSVYGYIPAGSNQPAGSYTDTVTVTATF